MQKQSAKVDNTNENFNKLSDYDGWANFDLPHQCRLKLGQGVLQIIAGSVPKFATGDSWVIWIRSYIWPLFLARLEESSLTGICQDDHFT